MCFENESRFSNIGLSGRNRVCATRSIDRYQSYWSYCYGWVVVCNCRWMQTTMSTKIFAPASHKVRDTVWFLRTKGYRLLPNWIVPSLLWSIYGDETLKMAVRMDWKRLGTQHCSQSVQFPGGELLLCRGVIKKVGGALRKVLGTERQPCSKAKLVWTKLRLSIKTNIFYFMIKRA